MKQPSPPLHWGTTTFLLVTPLIALVGIPWYIAVHGLAPVEILTFFILWVGIGLAVTAGYHRLYAHRSYDAAWPVRLVLLIFGAGAIQTSVLKWSYKHRIHHAFVDREPDPYNIQRGFWWAHMGWVMYSDTAPVDRERVKDLLADPLVAWQDRYYYLILALVAAGIPLLVGILSGHVLGCLLIGCVGRIVMTHHVTFFINSLCHMVGRQPYSRAHSARDSALMAVLAFGEGYHNFHHTFPFDYRNGIRAWHIDPAKWIISTLAKLRLAWGLKRAPDLAILKAKIGVEYESIHSRLAKMSQDLRATNERRLQDAYESLQRSMRSYFEYFHTDRFRREPGDPILQETRKQVLAAFEGAREQWRLTVRRLNGEPRIARMEG